MRALLLLFVLIACGEDKVETVQLPPAPGPVPIPGNISFKVDIKPLIENNCALSGCHANESFTRSETKFLSSQAKARIGNDTMPPQYSPKIGEWGEAQKSVFTAYFDGQ